VGPVSGLLTMLALGFFLGARHATDPDHVIAVSTIVARHRATTDAALIGAIWGVGHTFTLLVAGGGIVLFGWVIPRQIGLSLEFAVAVMLMALGIANLSNLREVARSSLPTRRSGPPVHSRTHRDGDDSHTHPHGHDPEVRPDAAGRIPLGRLDSRLRGIALYQMIRPLAVGVVHGLAGSATVGLLVLTTTQEARWWLLYLFLFGIGTIVGMMLITVAISWPFAFRPSPRVAGRLQLASGLSSVGFGCLLAYRVGVTQGLFT
jgi:ABC-type nickel/cobalt efflux system permease component RcnA